MNWWASTSAWAVPLRQGALKETQTRTPGSAMTAPEGEGRAQTTAAPERSGRGPVALEPGLDRRSAHHYDHGPRLIRK